MATDLTPKQQRFADLVLGGMPASRAYREVGYPVRTDAAAEACASRLLSSAKVAAYIAERRAAAADRAELDYAGFLRKFADFSCDKDVNQAQRLAACRLVAEHPERLTPLASAVPEAFGEATVERAARVIIGLLVDGQWRYLYRAVDGTDQTIDFLLSAKRDKKVAKRIFRQALGRDNTRNPRTIITDRLKSYPGALREMKRDGELWRFTRHCRGRWLNNWVEQDHRRIKRRTGPMLGFQSFWAGRRTLAGVEAMAMLAKGQVWAVPADDMSAQRAFIHQAFGLAA